MPNDEAMKAAPSLPRVELTIPSLPPLELIIEDESMAPEFMAGDEIVIDPAVKPEDERDFVLVRMSNGEHLFRRYRPRGKSAFDLIAENAAWKTVSIVTPSDAASVTILGTMVEHRRKRRGSAKQHITAAAEHAADAVIELINSRVQSPTKGELVAIILDNFGEGVSPHTGSNKRLNTLNEIITWLGGPTGAADWTGLTAGEVESWLVDHQIPPGWHLRMVLRAQSEGYAICPKALGLRADGRPIRRAISGG